MCRTSYETTTYNALKRAGVPKRCLDAEPRPDLLGGAYLYGKTGRGKTYAACGAIRAYVEAHVVEVGSGHVYYGPRARFVNVPDWFAQMRATYDSNESEREVFERYAECGLLVLDDLGKGSRTEWAVERLYMLFDHRCNEELPTIITSNYGLGQCMGMLTTDQDSMQAMASRALDICGGNGILMEGEDLRRKKIGIRKNSHQ